MLVVILEWRGVGSVDFRIGGRFEIDPTWLSLIRAPEQNREDLFGLSEFMTRQSSHDSSSRAREFCQLGTDILCLFVLRRQARSPFQNSQSRNSRNRPSAKNQPRVRDFRQPVLARDNRKGLQKETRGDAPAPRPNAPAHGRDASEVSTSTPSGVQPHFLTKTTMSNALAAPAARATTPATVRALTRLIFPGRGPSSGHGCPRCPPAGFTRGSRTPRASVPAHRTARDASPARGFPSEKRSRDARGAPRRITPCRRFDALPHR